MKVKFYTKVKNLIQFGIVYQKKKSVIIYCIINLLYFFCKTHKITFSKNVVTKQFRLPFIEWTKNTTEVNGNRNCLLTKHIQNILCPTEE